MNDINIKLVESPKETVVVGEIGPAVDGDNEIDPLAIDDVESGKVKEFPTVETAGKDLEEKDISCDEHAKEENVNEIECKDNNSIDSKSDTIIDSDEQKRETNVNVIPPTQSNEIKIDGKPIKSDTEVYKNIIPEVSCLPVTVETEKPVDVIKKDPTTEVNKLEQIANKLISKDDKEVKKEEEKSRLDEKNNIVDIEMIESDQRDKADKKVESKSALPVNGDIAKEDQSAKKRRISEDVETESPLKKLCQEVEKTFPQHDTMINDYIQTATKNNVDEIQSHTEQLLSEIQTLRGLAQKKEHEWNNILHLKKVKEEILLRLLRRKQVLSFEKSADMNGSDRSDPFDYLNQAKNLAIDKSDEISGLSIKQPGSSINTMMQSPVMPVTSHFNPMSGLPPPYDKAHLQNMPKPVYPQQIMMPGPTMQGFPRDMNGQLPTNFGMPMGRQGPTKDVKSIIADYRQRNPEITPRRGRRMKSILNPNMMNTPRPIAPKMDGLSSLNNLTNLSMLFNNLDMNQKAMLERLQQVQAGGLPNGLSFKDVLVQFANMQQSAGLIPNRPDQMMNRPDHHMRPENRRRQERNHDEVHKPRVETERLASPNPRLPPPPYPEISLLPVNQETSQASQNSLLHGILTKQAPPASQSYSPTLAKLLTSPERKQSAPTLPTFGQAKNCGEITITPVQPTPPPQETVQQEKTEEVVQLDDEESRGSSGSASGSPSGSGSGRLVIDEAGGVGGAAGGGGSSEAGAGGGEAEGEGDAPLCQGCRRRDAQFVCAGCANQWYCSRDCQVAAWDEHSEMCSG